MGDAVRLATISALIGDPARATMLAALMDGRALTAGELAHTAGVTPQTASAHLGRLADSGLLARAVQGRHRYYRLADGRVGAMLESILAVAGPDPAPHRIAWRGGAALRDARSCYDHLAGRLAVALADALIARGHVVFTEDGGALTETGRTALAAFGALPPRTARRFCRPCLDWSERRPHIAGSVGAAIADRCFALGWIARQTSGRALTVTPRGRAGFAQRFGVRPEAYSAASA